MFWHNEISLRHWCSGTNMIRGWNYCLEFHFQARWPIYQAVTASDRPHLPQWWSSFSLTYRFANAKTGLFFCLDIKFAKKQSPEVKGTFWEISLKNATFRGRKLWNCQAFGRIWAQFLYKLPQKFLAFRVGPSRKISPMSNMHEMVCWQWENTMIPLFHNGEIRINKQWNNIGPTIPLESFSCDVC
jgi:hypothetical protein